MYYQTHTQNNMLTKFYNSRFNNVEDTFSIYKIKPLYKHKHIHKCQISCRQHRFTLRKTLNPSQQNFFVKKVEDVYLAFCPNEFFGMVSGGFPVFNFDGKSETPAFQAKYELNSAAGKTLYSEKFLKRKEKFEKQNSPVQHQPSIKFQMRLQTQNKIFDEKIIQEFQEILKQKNRIQNNKFQ